MDSNDIMEQQAKMMEARMKAGGLKKKGPLVKKEQEKKIFDSADYQMKKEQEHQHQIQDEQDQN